MRPILFESQSTQKKTGSMNGETNLIVNANKFKLENELSYSILYTWILKAYVHPPPPNKTSYMIKMILEVFTMALIYTVSKIMAVLPEFYDIINFFKFGLLY